MKKTLVSALTAALVVGAAGTVFAAANPFSDVPADHWAYDAVAQLAQDGIIDGYGDASFRGQQEITRYEMAQMIARAMAKGSNGVDQALLDKLAAEFAEELNALGVRVAALEKKVDNVTWTGRIRWRTSRTSTEPDGKAATKADTSKLIFRLEPKAVVNKHWFVQTRLDYALDGKAYNSPNGGLGAINRMWAQGQYGKTTIKLGKLPFTTQADYGMTHAWTFTGAAVTTGNKLKVDVYGGRFNRTDIGTNGIQEIAPAGGANAANLFGLAVYNDRKAKFTYGLGYMHLSGHDYNHRKYGAGAASKEDTASIIHGGLGYKFNKNLLLTAAYGQNTQGDMAAAERRRMHFELKYGAANKAKPGSWEAWVNYMSYGKYSGLRTAEWLRTDIEVIDFRGFSVGAKVTLDKNIDVLAAYYDGSKVGTPNTDFKAVATELNFYF